MNFSKDSEPFFSGARLPQSQEQSLSFTFPVMLRVDAVVCSETSCSSSAPSALAVLWRCLLSQPNWPYSSALPATGLRAEAKAIIFAHIPTARLFPFLVFHLMKLVTTHGGLAAAAAAQLPQICMNLFSVERSRGNLFSCWPC